MTATQLDLLASTEPYNPPEGVTGAQHAQVLVALYNEGSRGLCGEEAAQRCNLRDAHIATSRLNEMGPKQSDKDREKFPVPLVYRSEKRERPTASGVRSFVFYLTDAGRSLVEGWGG